ncbi:hypothetical protein ONZ45_g19088 [Pleurotus djamor]|nr:hypothetical protein ONZ45_g19088 [Pleurotus djamor]
MDQPAVLTTTSVLATVNPTFDPTTLGPQPTVNAVGAASSDSFWDNKGAVAGVFTASGLVVLALMVASGLYIRRYYARKREDDWLNNYQDVGSSASSPRPRSSPVPSMSEVNTFPPTTTYPQPIVGRDLYTDYPPGTQYAPYVPPDVVYGTAITHDGVNSGNQYAVAYGGNHQPNNSYTPTVSSEPSTYSSASSQHHPYAAPIVTVTPAPNPPPSFQVNSQRPLSYDSFYTGQPSPRP